jgi:hypothetical protein
VQKALDGTVAFSPELNEARLLIKVWSLVVNKAKGRRVSSRMLSRALKKVNLPPEERGYEENLLQENLKFGYQEYYKIKGNAKELHQTALENLAKAMECYSGKSA